MRIKTFFAFVFSCASLLSMAQVVDVDTYSGKAITTIPIWKITSGPLSFPIVLTHATGGIKVNEPTGPLGTGWSISKGGSISREVRGLPDDWNSSATSSDPAKQGWLIKSGSPSVTVGGTVSGFVPQADDDLSVSTDEKNDYNSLNSLGGFSSGTILDTEPDVFNVQAPGLSFSFVFDNNGQVAFLGKQDYLITKLYSSNGFIASFKVVDDNGVTYYFGNPTIGSTQAVLTDAKGVAHNESDITYFKYQYNLYKAGVSYNTIWALLSMESPNGDRLAFEYYNQQNPITSYLSGAAPLPRYIQSLDEVNAYVYDDGTGYTTKKFQYSLKKSVLPELQLTKVVGRTETAYINFDKLLLNYGDYQLKQDLIGSIQIYDTKQAQSILERKFTMDYATVGSTTASQFDHIFLRAVTESSPTILSAPYLFDYNGVDIVQKKIVSSTRDDLFKDEFGFNNVCCSSTYYKAYIYPSLNGVENGIDAVRNTPWLGYPGTFIEVGLQSNQPTLSNLQISTLSKITLPNGGVNRIFYEPNYYRDATSQVDSYGGGLRVSRLEYHDGVDFANDITKYYSYVQDDGTSSGALLFRPLRTFNLNFYKSAQTGTINYYHQILGQNLSSDQLWKRTLVSSALPLNDDQNPGAFVGYKKVTVKQIGAGKTVYEFDMPGAFGTKTETDWTATRSKIARQSPPDGATNIIAHDLGPISTGYYAYPFAPNPNYDYKRGLLKKTTAYSEANLLVSQTDYEYTYLTSPTKVYGVRMDQYSAPVTYTTTGPLGSTTAMHIMPMFMYGRYEVNTNIHPRLLRTTQKVVDQNDPTATKMITSVETMEYGSSAHDRVTKRTQIGSDGVEYSTNYKYTFDYTIAAPFAYQDDATKAIYKFKEKNIYQPIETWTTKKEGTETPLTTKAELKLYTYNLNNTISLVSSLSVSSFAPVSLGTSSVTNNGTTSSVFTYDQAHYNRHTDYQYPDNFGTPRTTVNFDRTKSGVLFGWNGTVPKLLIDNAAADEIAFSDFESPSDCDFVVSNSILGVQPSGRVSGNTLTMSANTTKISKSLKRGLGQGYIFSCWIQSTTAGVLTLNVNDGVHTQGSVAYNFPISNSWTYVTVPVQTSTFNSTITVDIQSSVQINIDDALFYPAASTPTTFIYGTGLTKLAETDARGISTYYQYDDFNRLLYVRDNDQNILKAFTYKQDLTHLYLLSDLGVIYTNSEMNFAYPNKVTTFTGINSGDIANTTFKWKIVNLIDFKADPSIINDFDHGAIVVTGSNKMDYTFTQQGNWLVNLQTVYNGTTRQLASPEGLATWYGLQKVSICSNRPILLDACHPTKDFTCNLLGPPDLVLTSTVTDGTGNFTYNWQRIPFGGDGTATPMGTTSNLTVSDYLPYSAAYRLTVTDNNPDNPFAPFGGSAYQVDAFFYITIYKSDPNCTIPSGQ